MPFLMLLLPLLAKIPGMIGDYFKQQAELMQAQLQTEKEIELAKQQYAAEAAKAQFQLNQTIVQSTSSNFKYFTFVMWFGPFMVSLVSPSLSKEIFNNLAVMPEWYTQSCMLIMFTIWGITVSSPIVSSIFSNFGSFIAERRQYKLEKAKIDRTAYFDALRKAKGPLSQAEVDVENKILDEAEK